MSTPMLRMAQGNKNNEYPEMLPWCAVSAVVITWLILLTILIAMLAARYSEQVETLESDNLLAMELAFSDIVDITNTIQVQLDYLNNNSQCTSGLCGPNTTTIPDIYSSLIDLGCWDADSNTPTLTSGVGTLGNAYIVCTAGNTSLDNNSVWAINDFLFFIDDSYNGNRWVRHGAETPTLDDSGGPYQTIINNGAPGTTWILKQIADGNTGKVAINDSDPANIVISLTSLATEEQLRTYPTLSGTSTSVLTSTGWNSTPSVLSEQWIRRGDMLSGTFVVQAGLGSVGVNRIRLGTFPLEILDELGGPTSVTTLSSTSVWCDAHRSFSTSSPATNDDYVYLLRNCWVDVTTGGGVNNAISVCLEGDVLSIGAGAGTAPVRLVLTILMDALAPFSM